MLLICPDNISQTDTFPVAQTAHEKENKAPSFASVTSCSVVTGREQGLEHGKITTDNSPNIFFLRDIINLQPHISDTFEGK